MFNFSDLKNHITDAAGGAEKLRAIGDILQYALPWGALAAIALAGKQEFAYSWLLAVGITMFITQAMKILFDNTRLGTRPDGGRLSFPSGHTSGAFSGAWVIVAVFGWLWGAVPLALAFVTGLSRVVSKRHWWRDVVAGAAVAAAVTYYVFAHV